MSSERPPRKRKSVIPGWEEGDGTEKKPQRKRRPKPESSAEGKRTKPRARPVVPPVPEPPPSETGPKARPTEATTTAPMSETGAAFISVEDASPTTTGPQDPSSLSAKLVRWKNDVLRRPALVTGVVLGLLVVGLLANYFLSGPGREKEAPVDDDEIVRLPPGDVPLPEDVAGRLRVYTKPGPEFVVLVDGEPVRSEAGEFLVTPCEIVLDARSSHRITVAKDGFRDSTKIVTPSASEAMELVYEPDPDPANQSVSMLDAAWFGVPVGQPIELVALNTPELQSDPFLTEDGLTIYFVSTGLGGTSIHHASRATPFDVFESPQSIPTTSSFDVARSPGVVTLGDEDSGDRTTYLVYTAKSRVQFVERTNVFRGFGEPKVFRFDPDRGAPWTAAQLIDGGRALYWTANQSSGPVSYFSARDDLDREFESTLKIDLPGGVPSLSHDGLRQYVYDGRTLSRARRTSIYEWGTQMKRGREVPKLMHVPLSELETIAELPIDDYVAAPGYRQYFVTADEQWMFYVNDPTRSGDLFVVRIHEGPGWGYRTRGEPIENLDFGPVTVAGMDTDTGSQPLQPVVRGEDPRSKPLPYTSHRTEFETLMAKRDYEGAADLAERRTGEPEFAESRQLLEWDLLDVERVRAMWRDAERGAASMQPGDTFRNKSVTLEFVRFEDGTIVGTVGDQEVSIELADMTATNVTSLVDRNVAEDDTEGQMRVATFLYYEPDTIERALEARRKRAPELAAEFDDRLVDRMLEQARQEIARDNYRPGLAWLAKVREMAPDSDAAGRADAVETELFRRTKWETVGPRKWSGMENAEYAAGSERAADSWLLSPKPLDGFELQLEYRITARNGSGGVFFRYSDPAPRRLPYRNNVAFKVHVANDAGLAPDPVSTGSLFTIEAPTKNASKRMGEWNTLRMVVRGQQVQVWINDEAVLETVANNPRIPLAGHVALDGITGGITYRKVLLLELPGGS